MMKYKFRGKRVDNGEWVYGSLLHGENIVLLSGLAYPVNPDSVGMWTGLKDKNDVEVYEGDCLTNTKKMEYIGIGHYERIVSWVESDGGFMISDGDIKRYGLFIFRNIHENPDLLVGGE